MTMGPVAPGASSPLGVCWCPLPSQTPLCPRHAHSTHHLAVSRSHLQTCSTGPPPRTTTGRMLQVQVDRINTRGGRTLTVCRHTCDQHTERLLSSTPVRWAKRDHWPHAASGSCQHTVIDNMDCAGVGSHQQSAERLLTFKSIRWAQRVSNKSQWVICGPPLAPGCWSQAAAAANSPMTPACWCHSSAASRLNCLASFPCL